MTTVAVLQQCRFFADLDDTALTTIAQHAYPYRISSGYYLFHQGEPATTFYVLTQGRARVLQSSPEGQQVILGLIGAHREAGIVAAIEQAEYPLSLQAVEECHALAWDSAPLRDLLAQYPILALRAMRMVTGRFVQLQNLYRELATERVERRVARALLRLVAQAGEHTADGIRITIALSRQDIGEMTGTTLYTVSRIVSGWEKQGIVTAGRERVLVRDLARLTAIADDLASPTPTPDPPCAEQ